jgi:centromere protein I
LDKLVDLVVTPSYLNQGNLNHIIKNLYPATRLRGDTIWKVVGCLGHGQLKPLLTLQAAILRWLIMAYHVIDNPSILSRAYAVLFNLLDTTALR